METQQLVHSQESTSEINDDFQEQTIDNPSQSLLESLKTSPEIVVRSLIPLDNSLPHNRHLGFYSTLILFIGRILGSGIFATPGLIMKDSQGSYSLYLICWVTGGLIAYSGLALYLELGSYLPVNGATKKFLEYIFPNPKYLTSFVFGLFTVIFSLSSPNALVFGEYLRYAFGLESNESKTKMIACSLIVICGIVHGSNKRIGLKCLNILGTLKLMLLGIIMITCFYVLIIPEKYTGLTNNLTSERFKLPKSSSFSGSLYATALLKCIHSLGGWTTSHTVQNEIKDPIKVLRVAGPLSIIIIIVLYMLLNLCYLIIIPYEQFMNGDQLIGALLFTEVYGHKFGTLLVNLIISISSATNVLIVVFSDSIMNQEVFKEGFLPFSEKLCSNALFSGTPIGGIFIHCFISCFIIYVPHKSIYNYVISIQYYPNQVFHAILCIALLFKLRRKFPNIHAPIRASTSLIYICLMGSLSVVLSPFISGDFKFTLVSLGILSLGFVYWVLKIVVLPYLGGYEYDVVILKKEDGLVYKKWIKVYNEESIA